jgi:hypothetical protein
LPYYLIHFLLCIVFAEAETYGYLVGVVADGADDMASLVGAGSAGTAAAGADIIDIKVEKEHFGSFGLGKTDT